MHYNMGIFIVQESSGFKKCAIFVFIVVIGVDIVVIGVDIALVLWDS